VKLYVPRLHGDSGLDLEAEGGARPALSRGSETILVVEDEDDVRTYSTEILRELGYRVLNAAGSEAALRILDHHPEIALLFTDVGLPGGMNGRMLADEARKRQPKLKVLFTTGYARNAIVHDGRLDPGVQLITKPFTYASLATKLRDILDASGGPARILLVEDEGLIRMLATEHLEAAGYRVEAAITATDALNRARLMQGKIDAAIVDLGLPDGRDDFLVSQLRAQYPDLPIIIASGYEAHLRARLKQDPRVKFLPKPYTPEQLLKIVRSVCE
jgi:CheY-like chemotaxis protein